MKDKTKVKIAFAEAVTQMLWLKGMLTLQERDQMNQNAAARLQNGKC